MRRRTEELEASLHEEHAVVGRLEQHADEMEVSLQASLHEKHASEGSLQQRISLVAVAREARVGGTPAATHR